MTDFSLLAWKETMAFGGAAMKTAWGNVDASWARVATLQHVYELKIHCPSRHWREPDVFPHHLSTVTSLASRMLLRAHVELLCISRPDSEK